MCVRGAQKGFDVREMFAVEGTWRPGDKNRGVRIPPNQYAALAEGIFNDLLAAEMPLEDVINIYITAGEHLGVVVTRRDEVKGEESKAAGLTISGTPSASPVPQRTPSIRGLAPAALEAPVVKTANGLYSN